MNLTKNGMFQRVRETLPPRIVLHVGMTKAGSTAIQNTLDKNYDDLLRQNILFPRSVFTRPNPYSQDGTPGHVQLIRDVVGGDLETFEHELLSVASNVETLVLSAENIFLDIDAATRNALAGLFEGKTVEIVCLLREQVGWCASRYYESVAKGYRRETRIFEDFVDHLIVEGKLDYYERLNDLAAAIGANRIVAADYDALKANGSVVPWFLQVVGLKNASLIKGADQLSNVSQAFPEVIEAHRRINGLIGVFSDDQRFAWTARMQEIATAALQLRGLPVSHIKPTSAVRGRILDACEKSNQKLSETYLKGAPFGPGLGSLEPPPPPLNEEFVNELVATGINLLSGPAKAQRTAYKAQKAELSKVKAKLKQQEAAAIKRQASLAARDAMLALREAEAHREAGRADATTEALVAAHIERADAEQRAREYATKLADMNAQLTARETALALREEEARREAERADAAAEALGAAHANRADAEQRARTTTNQLTTIERTLEQTRKESDLLRMEMDNIRAELGTLRTSTSWRLTAPLRAISAVVELQRLREKVSTLKFSGLNPIRALRHHHRVKDTTRTLSGSPFFDADWYLRRYPDLVDWRGNPVEHYVRYGAKEGRDPSPHFSAAWYIEAYPDVAENGANPLEHYIKYGKSEKRQKRGVQSVARAVEKHGSVLAVCKKFAARQLISGSEGSHKAQASLRRAESKAEEWRIRSLRDRMLTLGFEERAQNELARYAKDTRHPNLMRLAAWELASWRLSKGAQDDVSIALKFLSIAKDGEIDLDTLRRIAIMEAEALDLQGSTAEAANVLKRELEITPHADLYLGLANFAEHADERLRAVNQALALNNLEAVECCAQSGRLFDALQVRPLHPISEAMPLLSVIMPAYNAEHTIRTAVASIRAQTWTNFELLIVDDCSPDQTAEVVRQLAEQDSRIRVLHTPVNSGPYVARNIALREARGDLVTCHDADDWSHPRKLELQARDILDSPKIIANQAVQARANDDLIFSRRGNPGLYCFSNISSFMFRRDPVLERIGYWDSVRFMGDGEFKRRLELAFNARSTKTLEKAFTSFQRQSSTSLTEDERIGYPGYLKGARKEYFDASTQHHQAAESLRYDFPQVVRPFAVPRCMLPDSNEATGRRHFDVIIASDFRLAGGSTLSSLEEIQAQARGGLRCGLVQMCRYDMRTGKRRMNSKVRKLVNDGYAEVVVYGESVTCDLLIIRYPPVLHEFQSTIPHIDAANIRVIVNQPPMSDYGPNAVLRYNIPQCAKHLRAFFGKDGIWHPIGPAVREALHEHHCDQLDAIQLSPNDWVNIVDLGEWRRPARPAQGTRPRIGRHARDHEMKWPADKETLLTAYPASDKYEVYIMGGASVPERLLGSLPSNWRVVPFDGIPVREYLAELDVFVYYTNTAWVESFGRVIIEAMACGVPVILPPTYRPLFEDAALYAEPHGIENLIDQLIADPAFYESRVRHAWDYVDRRFGYGMHLERVRDTINSEVSTGIAATGKASA